MDVNDANSSDNGSAELPAIMSLTVGEGMHR